MASTPPPAAAENTAAARSGPGQAGALAAVVGAYARACLSAVRPERDWFRQAVTQLEAAGDRIVQTEHTSTAGGTWLVLDWRTGQNLASICGGHDAYDAAWQDGWTDVCWIGRWIEGLATDGQPAPDWPAALPSPPDVAQITASPPPPLALSGLPASLRARLEEAIDAWAVAAGVTKGRVAEVALLCGWTEDQVLACTGSYLTMTGEQYMRSGEAAEGWTDG